MKDPVADPNKDRLFLFQYIEKKDRRDVIMAFFNQVEEEKWKHTDPKDVELVLEFFAEARDMGHVAQMVRTNPNARWALVTGKMQAIQVAVPVFINGISLDSFEKEW